MISIMAYLKHAQGLVGIIASFPICPILCVHGLFAMNSNYAR